MPVQNTLGDMHSMLLEQMQRLAEADGDEVALEVERSRSMASIATAVNNNAATIIKAWVMKDELSCGMPRILGAGSEG